MSDHVQTLIIAAVLGGALGIVIWVDHWKSRALRAERRLKRLFPDHDPVTGGYVGHLDT